MLARFGIKTDMVWWLPRALLYAGIAAAVGMVVCGTVYPLVCFSPENLIWIPVSLALGFGVLLYAGLAATAIDNAYARRHDLYVWPDISDAQRRERMQGMRLSIPKGFAAAGRKYPSEFMLRVCRTRAEHVYKDCYGRSVLCLRERFPCFDSADYLHEDRYFRWYFILCHHALTLVYTQDESDEYSVTENLTREQMDRCGLSSSNRACFAASGFDTYLREN